MSQMKFALFKPVIHANISFKLAETLGPLIIKSCMYLCTSLGSREGQGGGRVFGTLIGTQSSGTVTSVPDLAHSLLLESYVLGS